jgi:predicted RNA-binding Zn-ribbon protein involved in translation (DUF1610 family)
MKCLACGRNMLNKGTHFICPNLLCDYTEEIENREERASEVLLEHISPIMAWAIN